MDSLLQSGLHVLGQPRDLDGACVNAAAIKGEPGTGFEKRSDKGPFECGNCEYFDSAAGACDQWDMKQKSKQPRLDDSRVSVAHDDCCEYLSRMERDADD